MRRRRSGYAAARLRLAYANEHWLAAGVAGTAQGSAWRPPWGSG